MKPTIYIRSCRAVLAIDPAFGLSYMNSLNDLYCLWNYHKFKFNWQARLQYKYTLSDLTYWSNIFTSENGYEWSQIYL